MQYKSKLAADMYVMVSEAEIYESVLPWSQPTKLKFTQIQSEIARSADPVFYGDSILTMNIRLDP